MGLYDQPDVDPREFGPHPDEELCPECNARADEACQPWCGCDACWRQRGDDVAAFCRDQQIAAMRVK